MIDITNEVTHDRVRWPYALRRVPQSLIASIAPMDRPPQVGDLALARIVDIGRTTRIELDTGRMCTLYPGDLLAVVFGHRYATAQYEAYARVDGDRCDLLTVAGVCGQVETKQESTSNPTKLAIIGYFCDDVGRTMVLRDFALEPAAEYPEPPRTIVVCGAAMDAGKTYAATSIVRGLVATNIRVGAAKLTGTATGKNVWSVLDAGAFEAYDFSDCGFPSTFGCSLHDLLSIHKTLSSNLAAGGAKWVVFEIADGVLQQETEALLTSPTFTQSVDMFVYAAGGSLSVVGGVARLRSWGIEPVAVSGKLTKSPLAMREAEEATGVRCLTAKQLTSGVLNEIMATTALSPAGSHQNGWKHKVAAKVS